jgi:hypothetical protein
MNRYKKLLICKANAMICGLPVAAGDIAPVGDASGR